MLARFWDGWEGKGYERDVRDILLVRGINLYNIFNNIFRGEERFVAGPLGGTIDKTRPPVPEPRSFMRGTPVASQRSTLARRPATRSYLSSVNI